MYERDSSCRYAVVRIFDGPRFATEAAAAAAADDRDYIINRADGTPSVGRYAVSNIRDLWNAVFASAATSPYTFACARNGGAENKKRSEY